MFNALKPTVVFQEVPNEIALCISITGCKVGCKGCHSTELWDEKNGFELTDELFNYWLSKYQGLISCVCFMGGEWQLDELKNKLSLAKTQGLKTCLYTGQDTLAEEIKPLLDFAKLGRWRQELGGLSSSFTNQRFINVASGENLNPLFIKNIAA